MKVGGCIELPLDKVSIRSLQGLEKVPVRLLAVYPASGMVRRYNKLVYKCVFH